MGIITPANLNVLSFLDDFVFYADDFVPYYCFAYESLELSSFYVELDAESESVEFESVEFEEPEFDEAVSELLPIEAESFSFYFTSGLAGI